jgi:tetratricopeptide (TPR) repeat protein
MLRAESVVRVVVVLAALCAPLAQLHAQEAPPPAPAAAPVGNEPEPELMKKVEVDPEKERAARGLFDAGSLAFNEGRFEDALSYFKQAYDLAPKPKLLFNIGTVLDRLRRDREALSTFKEYLARVPQATNRAAVEARVKVLQETIDKEDALVQQAKEKAATDAAAAQQQQSNQPAAQPAETQAPVAQSSPAEPAKKPNLVPLIVVGSATVVVGGIALWSHLDTSSALDAYKKDPTKKNYDDGVGKQTRTNILLIGTGALAVATGVIAYFTFSSGSGSESASAGASASLTPWLSPNSAGATADVRF